MSVAQIVDALTPLCERLEVAGAHRRGLESDAIEIVCVPLWEWRGNDTVNRVCEWVAMRPRWDWRVPVLPGSPVYRGTMPDGHPLALWQAQDGSFGSILLARTGPVAYVQRIRDHAATLGMAFIGGSLVVDGVPVTTPEEVDVFAYLKLPYVPPAERR